MDKINFPYRTNSHLQLMYVVAESGSFEKYGLEVNYDQPISSSRAHAGVLSGDIEFVSGNHVSPYGHRARGDRWVYVGQTVNYSPGRKLIVRADSPINSIADLREKVVGTRGSHPLLNDWLQLKQSGLDVDRDEVKIVDQFGETTGSGDTAMEREDPSKSEAEAGAVWEWVRDGKVDATFLPVPQPFFAEKAGLKLIEPPPFPMIYFSTISTCLAFTEKHPDIVERLLKAMMEGIHFFKTQPERTTQILKQRYHKAGTMDDDIASKAQACLAEALEPALYPSTAAIDNVYQEGIRHDPDAKRINPMSLWDLHFIRRIDDSGFVENLYKARVPAQAHS